MFGKNFQRKYALTDQGVKKHQKGRLLDGHCQSGCHGRHGHPVPVHEYFDWDPDRWSAAARPGALLGLVIAFVILSFVTHLQQYHATYGLVYNEVKSTRLSLAERLRKLPLGLLRQAGSGGPDRDPHGRCEPHGARLVPCLGHLYGALHLHGEIAVCLLVYDWRLRDYRLPVKGGAGGLRHCCSARAQPEDRRP